MRSSQHMLCVQVIGVIDNKPRLMFDARISDSNSLGPLSTCNDLVVSPVIEPVYHSLAVRKATTDPGDYLRHLKCSLDNALVAFEEGDILFR